VLLVALAKDEAGAGGDAVEERVDNVTQPREEPLAGAARIMANEMGRKKTALRSVLNFPNQNHWPKLRRVWPMRCADRNE
jgi:hypothetical protein